MMERGYSWGQKVRKSWLSNLHEHLQNHHLVGGWATPLKNMKVNWDDDIPNIWENKKWIKMATKPPTSHLLDTTVLWRCPVCSGCSGLGPSSSASASRAAFSTSCRVASWNDAASHATREARANLGADTTWRGETVESPWKDGKGQIMVRFQYYFSRILLFQFFGCCCASAWRQNWAVNSGK